MIELFLARKKKKRKSARLPSAFCLNKKIEARRKSPGGS